MKIYDWELYGVFCHGNSQVYEYILMCFFFLRKNNKSHLPERLRTNNYKILLLKRYDIQLG